jgi:hypothetical protein
MTSLHGATVVDNTTFCRGDDDIIVIEFYEDEKGTFVFWTHVYVIILYTRSAHFVSVVPRYKWISS